MSKRIIAFAGRKRSGKGMLANGIKEQLKGKEDVEVVTVADNLKFLCADLLHTTYEKLVKMKDDGTTFSEKADGRWIGIINDATGISDNKICRELNGKVFTNVREVLQVIGTDVIRKYCPNWHINKTIERIKSIDDSKIIVVDDVRFPNEKCEIEKIGGDVYFVIRPNCFDVSNHPSETALTFNDFIPQRVIINDLPKEDMVAEFVKYYFSDDKTLNESQILLRRNMWYIQNMIDLHPYDTNEEVERRSIIKKVLNQNINSLTFLRNGIITFDSSNNDSLVLFRKYFMNDKRNSDGKSAYAIYNPLTNEYLKQFM